MKIRRLALVLAAAAAAALGTVHSAFADAEPTTQELLEQIKQLQAKVEKLEAKQKEDSAAEAAEVAATIDEIYRDATRRSQLLQSDGDILAGWENNKFFIRSSDGNYLLVPTFEMQIRNVSNYNTAGDDSFENGFDLRRLKFRFEGNAVTPDLTYALQWATNPSNGTPQLEDAWVRYKPGDVWALRAGQYKGPFNHEQIISGRRQLAADRSLLALVLTGTSDNYLQGISAIYEDKDQPIRAEVAFTDGIASANTNWRDFPVTSAHWGVTGRVEYFAFGDRKQYDDFTALNNKTDLLAFGAGFDVTESGSQTVYRSTLDAHWENTSGVGLYAAYLGRYTEDADASNFDWGLLLQGNYLFRPRWEAFARYDFILFDDDVAFAGGGTEDFFHELTIGVNYYIRGHAAKFTVDGTWLPNGSPNDQINLGILGGDDAQFMLRGQFQLLL